MQKELMSREKEKKEKELRELAQRARMEHGGMPLTARVDGKWLHFNSSKIDAF